MDSTTAAILAAIITGGLSLIGVILSNRAASSRMQTQLEKQQAITDTKLDELTREVQRHNNFAERVPVLEEKVKVPTTASPTWKNKPSAWKRCTQSEVNIRASPRNQADGLPGPDGGCSAPEPGHGWQQGK